MVKKLILSLILFVEPKVGPQKFYFRNLVSTVTRYHGLLTLCTKSEKTKDPILRKLSDRLMDPQREGMRRMFT